MDVSDIITFSEERNLYRIDRHFISLFNIRSLYPRRSRCKPQMESPKITGQMNLKTTTSPLFSSRTPDYPTSLTCPLGRSFSHRGFLL